MKFSNNKEFLRILKEYEELAEKARIEEKKFIPGGTKPKGMEEYTNLLRRIRVYSEKIMKWEKMLEKCKYQLPK